jgi:hypothetical protein
MLNCALECNVASASTLAVVKIGASKTEVRLLVAAKWDTYKHVNARLIEFKRELTNASVPAHIWCSL